MTARDLFLLGVRVLGLFFLFQAVASAAWIVSPLIQLFSAARVDLVRMLIFGVVSTMVSLVLGLAALLWTQDFADLFRWPPSELSLDRSITAHDLCLVAFRVAGVCAVFQAVEPAMNALHVFDQRGGVYDPGIDVAKAAVFMLLALVLLFAPHRLAAWLPPLDHRPGLEAPLHERAAELPQTTMAEEELERGSP